MKKYIFTFGFNHANKGYCQPIYAKSYDKAREKMFEIHGDKWAFQYDGDTWDGYKNDTDRCWDLEKELEPIYYDR